MSTAESLCYCITDYKYGLERSNQDLNDLDVVYIFNHWHKYFNNVVLKEDAIVMIKNIIENWTNREVCNVSQN